MIQSFGYGSKQSAGTFYIILVCTTLTNNDDGACSTDRPTNGWINHLIEIRAHPQIPKKIITYYIHILFLLRLRFLQRNCRLYILSNRIEFGRLYIRSVEKKIGLWGPIVKSGWWKFGLAFGHGARSDSRSTGCINTNYDWTVSYCMAKKSRPNLYSNYILGQAFLNRQ